MHVGRLADRVMNTCSTKPGYNTVLTTGYEQQDILTHAQHQTILEILIITLHTLTILAGLVIIDDKPILNTCTRWECCCCAPLYRLRVRLPIQHVVDIFSRSSTGKPHKLINKRIILKSSKPCKHHPSRKAQNKKCLSPSFKIVLKL